MVTMDNFCIMFLAGILILAAGIDFHRQKIPNLITYPGMVIALSYHGLTRGADGLLFSLAGLGVGIGILLVPYFMGGMGAGDAKLMGVVGAVIGAKDVIYALVLTSIIGGVYALVLILVQRKHFNGYLKEQMTTLWTAILIRKYIPDPIQAGKNRPRLCYGLAIAIGTGLYMFLNQLEHQISNLF